MTTAEENIEIGSHLLLYNYDKIGITKEQAKEIMCLYGLTLNEISRLFKEREKVETQD